MKKPHVDFYLLDSSSASGRLLSACHLTEKHYQEKHSVYLLLSSLEAVRTMDDLLWTYRDISFLPHRLKSGAPIVVSHELSETTSMDVLINLSTQVPETFHQFQSVIEIITTDPKEKETGRTHYRFYQAQGCTLKTHHLSTRGFS